MPQLPTVAIARRYINENRQRIPTKTVDLVISDPVTNLGGDKFTGSARYPIYQFEDACVLYGEVLALARKEFSAPLPKWREIEEELKQQWQKVTQEETIGAIAA